MDIAQAGHQDYKGEKMSGYREPMGVGRQGVSTASEQQMGHLNPWKLAKKALQMGNSTRLKTRGSRGW